MSKRISSAILAFGIGLLLIVVPQLSASAHHPEVTATAVCSNGRALITATTVAWTTDQPDHRVNNDILLEISQTGLFVPVDGFVGAFLPSNNYQFSANFTVPANGATYTVRATAVEPWGPNGEFGSQGEFREATVVVPLDCTVPSTSIPTTTLPPTTTAPPITSIVPSTTIPSTTIPPTTTAPINSSPISIERPPTTLAWSGDHTGMFVELGMILAFVGVVFMTGITVVEIRRKIRK